MPSSVPAWRGGSRAYPRVTARSFEAGGDGGEIGDVDLVETQAIDVGAREVGGVSGLNRLAGHHHDRLVERALTAARVHGAVVEQIEHADYPHAPLPTAQMVAE